jgi:hypothetical protein
MNKQKHRIILRTEQHRERALSLLTEAPLDYEVVIQKYKENKTLEQLGYCFAGIYPEIIRFVEDSMGESFSVEEMHKYMKKQILGVDHKELDGVVIEIERELKKSDKEAWCNYIDGMIRYAYNRWGLMISPPTWKE